MTGSQHALTLRSKGQRSNSNPNPHSLRLDHILFLHICYLYISTLEVKKWNDSVTKWQGYQLATSAINLIAPLVADWYPKTYIHPAWVYMSRCGQRRFLAPVTSHWIGLAVVSPSIRYWRCATLRYRQWNSPISMVCVTVRVSWLVTID